jgi:hypothetical protein
MEDKKLFVGLGGASVQIEGLSDAGVARIIYDLGGYFNISEYPLEGHSIVSRINYSSDSDGFDQVLETVKGHKYRVAPMHYPSNPQNHRFGKFSLSGDLEYVFDTTKKSNYILNHGEKEIDIFNKDPIAGAKDVRRLIRDQILMYWLESTGGLVIHSASFINRNGEGVIAVGGRGSGKTSFFMAGLSEESLTPLATERSIIVRKKDGFYLLALPEKINFLPGTLAEFAQCRDLVEGIDPSRYWERSAKFFVHWRKICERFNRPIEARSVKLKSIIFPRYAATTNRSEISFDEFSKRFEGEILTGSDPVVHNNWLSWFHFSGEIAKQVKEIFSAVDSNAVEWSSIEDIKTLLREA